MESYNKIIIRFVVQLVIQYLPTWINKSKLSYLTQQNIDIKVGASEKLINIHRHMYKVQDGSSRWHVNAMACK